MKKKLSVLVMDVDGTLTDGKIHIAATGESFKSFYVKDGYGINVVLPAHGIIPVIITGRTSEIVAHRARELRIQHLYQNVHNKAKVLQNIVLEMGVPLENVACIGDDLNELPMMQLCGICGCPSDAVSEVKAACDYVCEAPGGHGAVREFIEWMTQMDED